MEKQKRLLALDVLRGITVAAMIMVNNPGSWSYVYAPLRHSEWNGCTPTDLVFPFFIFVMGMAMYLSWSKTNYALTWRALGKLTYRGIVLILIGWAIACYIIMLRTFDGGGTWMDIWHKIVSGLRFPGVMPRLGLVSFFGGLLLLVFKPKLTPWVAAVLLSVYCIIIGVTDSFYLNAENVVARVDVAVFGENHIYEKGGVAFDPEGLLSTIPAVAQCLLGAFAGRLVMQTPDKWQKVNRLYIFGTIILLGGFLLDYAFPINKSLWSASYVLVTSGLAAMILALLMWIIDICDKRKWSVFFESFGANPLFIYVLAYFIVKALVNIHFISFDGTQYSVWSFWYEQCMRPLFGDKGGSLMSALMFVGIMWLIAHPLYKRKIYIKL